MQQAFNRIAENSVQLFRSSVEDGLLVGESTAQITRRLLGNSKAKDTANILQMAQKGGILTTPPINQVRTLVRTSINQVSNTAALNVYKANSDVTKKYRYVATLDSRTSAVCSALDGRIFTYEDGPKPPQHFNSVNIFNLLISQKQFKLRTIVLTFMPRVSPYNRSLNMWSY